MAGYKSLDTVSNWQLSFLEHFMSGYFFNFTFILVNPVNFTEDSCILNNMLLFIQEFVAELLLEFCCKCDVIFLGVIFYSV